jgi:hypothetical protein
MSPQPPSDKGDAKEKDASSSLEKRTGDDNLSLKEKEEENPQYDGVAGNNNSDGSDKGPASKVAAEKMTESIKKDSHDGGGGGTGMEEEGGSLMRGEVSHLFRERPSSNSILYKRKHSYKQIHEVYQLHVTHYFSPLHLFDILFQILSQHSFWHNSVRLSMTLNLRIGSELLAKELPSPSSEYGSEALRHLWTFELSWRTQCSRTS